MLKILKTIKRFLFGKEVSTFDSSIFNKISLIALLGWVGLGSDALSSSCYGPEEAFIALGEHKYLSVFVLILIAITIFTISASYSKIIELFPNGGGGYVVAGKLLSPACGMVAGCALIVDYILTITISVASGSEAIISFLPEYMHNQKLNIAIIGVLLLLILNLRGVKESIRPLVPIFMVFMFTHILLIINAIAFHSEGLSQITQQVALDVSKTSNEIGIIGVILLILNSYSMGAGTFTGIEAVSTGVPLLREPKVKNAKLVMKYMAVSLTFMASGLILSYLLFNISPQSGKTLNAVLFNSITSNWNPTLSMIFVLITLMSEAALLFVAAQAGFLSGPRILANMAVDRWLPTRFAMLSEQIVIQKGILIIGLAALGMLIITKASVKYIVVLYSINVFINFVLSQAGMIRYWLKNKSSKEFRKGILTNGISFSLSLFIFISMIYLKFEDGGWVSILITGIVISIVSLIKFKYNSDGKIINRFNEQMTLTHFNREEILKHSLEYEKLNNDFDYKARTAIILVNGFNGTGLYATNFIANTFDTSFKNFVFVKVGVLDATTVEGPKMLESLKNITYNEVNMYVKYANSLGYKSQGIFNISTDVVDKITEMAPEIKYLFPNSVFFGGQLVFSEDSLMNRTLHNYTIFSIQRRFYNIGIPLVIIPIPISKDL